MRHSEQIYFRNLPGGGFVAIEVMPFRTVFGKRRYLGEVVVERRIARERRAGHRAPAVARAEAASVAGVFHELFLVAQSNSAVAARCLAREGTAQPPPRLARLATAP